MTANRRASVRFPIQCPALVKFPRKTGSTEIIETCTNNISTGGVLLETRARLPLEMIVEVDIITRSILPGAPCEESDDDFISITGNIVRKGADGMAVAFDPEYRIFPALQQIMFLRRQLDWIIRHHDGVATGRFTVVN
jgi:hypothetical protein